MSGTTAPAPIVSHQMPEKNVASEEAVETVLKQYEGLKLGSEKSFIWPKERRPDIPHDQYDVEVPVIDLSPVLKLESLRKEIERLSEGESATRSRLMKEIEASEAAKSVVAKAIRAACEEYGLFQIINHGFPTEVVERFRKLYLHIFDLPNEEKLKIKQGTNPQQPSQPGYVGMKIDSIFTKNDPAYVWSETLNMESPEICVGRTEEIGNLIWSGEPETSRLFRTSTEEYAKQMTRVTFLLMDLIAASLAIPKESVEDIIGDQDNCKIRGRFRVNHYPICTHADMTWGLDEHTDPDLLTLVHQGDVGGLQTRFKDGTWHGVPPVPGAFVVNCGDYLEAWTNGRLVSPLHRVVPNKRSRRMSVGYFVQSEASTLISPRPECVDDEHPLRYRTFTVMEYLRAILTSGFPQSRCEVLDNVFGLSTPNEGKTSSGLKG